MNFKSLAAELLSQSRNLLPEWLPGGSFIGKEYTCASIAGGHGTSLKFNVDKGIGQDFASDQKFGDMIDLYAKINNISQGEAYKRLGGQSDDFNFQHKEYGLPVSTWVYRDTEGNPLLMIARYNVGDDKQFIPWQQVNGRWKAKALPAPRPLYGLELLKQRPEAPILIVEGEKTAEAARLIAPNFIVLTWPGGAKAWQKADWTPIYGRKAALWPDADEPGIAAVQGIARILAPHTTENALKILDVSDKPPKWDAADASMAPDEFISWCKQTVHVDVKALVIQTSELTEESKPTESQQVSIERLGLIVNEQGKPICNAANVARFFKNDKKYAHHLWWDEFHSLIFSDINGRREAWSDAMTVDMMIYFQNDLGMHRITSAMVYDGVSHYARSDRRHEVQDWMRNLVWDKKPRIGDFFTKYMGAESSPAMSAFGNNFWVLMVKRTFNPGSKADYMVVLQGSQGIGKTSAFEIIGSPWYTECSTSVESEDFFRQLQGKLLVEIAELHAFSNADQTRIKQVITQRVDRYREKYGRISIDHPRQGLLVGTTNEAEWIKDQTGGRRFWPVQCGSIDLDLLRTDRDQLFAEAVHKFYYDQDEGYLTPKEETANLQEAIRERDDWETILSEKLEYLNQAKQSEVLINLLRIPIERIDGRYSKRVCRVLRKLGFEPKLTRNGNVFEKKWFRNNTTHDTKETQNL